MKRSLGTLSELIQIVDQWEQAGSPVDDLLGQILPPMSGALPQVRALRIYQLAGDTWTLLAATDQTVAADAGIPAAEQPLYNAGLNTAQIVKSDDGRMLATALRRAGEVFALLELAIESQQEETPENEIWLGVFAAYLANGLDRYLNRQAQGTAQTAAANRRMHMLDTINRLATTLSTIDDEQELLDRTCEALYLALNADHVSVSLIGSDNQSATVVSEYPDRGSVGHKIDAGDDLHEQLREAGEPILINDVDNDPALAPLSREALQGSGVKSAMLLPLLDSRGGYIGAFGLDVLELGRPFTPEMVELARGVTAQVAVTLQNIRLLQSSQAQTEQMEQVATFGQMLQASLDVKKLLEIALTNIAGIIRADHIGIMFYDPVRGDVKPVARYDDGVSHIDPAAPTMVELDNTTAESVLETRTPLRITDLAEQDNLRHTFRDDVRSTMSTPLYSRGVVMGIIEVASTQPAVYREMDSFVFQQLASFFASAIENAETFTQTQRLAKSKALANEISSRLQQQSEIDQILEVTVRELGEALGARRARIRLATDVAVQDGRTE
jgi:GAF domain-containing protein